MTMKMKGLLKGLRYISQVFEADNKPHEMQIGYPTDVKHVAHIGWDGGPSVNAPSWMSEFRVPKSAPLSPAREATKPCENLTCSTAAEMQGSPFRESPKHSKNPRRRQPSNAPPSNSPTRESIPKQLADISINSPTREASNSPRQKSRHRHSSIGAEIPTQGVPVIPKQSRRKKTKGSGSSTSGSTRPSRSKAIASLSDPGLGVKNTEQLLALEYVEEKGL